MDGYILSGSSTPDLVFPLLIVAYALMSLCNQQYIQCTSGFLVVFAMEITCLKFIETKTLYDIAGGFKGIWVFAEVALFTFTGTSLSFNHDNGPLYGQRGLSGSQMVDVFGVMMIGTLARIGGIFFVCATSYTTFPTHRRELRYLAPFALCSWIFQLPKAQCRPRCTSYPALKD